MCLGGRGMGRGQGRQEAETSVTVEEIGLLKEDRVEYEGRAKW